MDFADMYTGSDAIKKIRPELSDVEAMNIVSATVAYAAMHQKWFWKR
jgi:hypothetical protein